MPITQQDWEAVDRILAFTDNAQVPDIVDIIATHRQAALIEGVKLGLEAAAGQCAWPECLEVRTEFEKGMKADRHLLARAIFGLDPTTIAGGK